jgi:hypothetical protein
VCTKTFHALTKQYLSIKFRVFWDVALCSHLEVDWRFRGAYWLHQALKMGTVLTSETAVNFKVTTRRYNWEDSKLRTHCRENLKSHIAFKWLINIQMRYLLQSYVCDIQGVSEIHSINLLARSVLKSTDKCVIKLRKLRVSLPNYGPQDHLT